MSRLNRLPVGPRLLDRTAVFLAGVFVGITVTQEALVPEGTESYLPLVGLAAVVLVVELLRRNATA